MNNSIDLKLISVLGSNLLDPAFDLVNQLQARNPSQPTEVQSSIVEHTYSASIILLTVAAMESCIRRAQFLNSDFDRSAIDYALRTFSDFHRVNEFEEVYVVRDAIIHNHIWESNVSLVHPRAMTLLLRKLSSGFGDSRFRRLVDQRSQKTKSLNLNVTPTSLTRSDVCIVMRMALDLLLYLEKKHNGVLITGRYFQLGNDNFLLSDALDKMESKWRQLTPCST